MPRILDAFTLAEGGVEKKEEKEEKVLPALIKRERFPRAQRAAVNI